MYIPHVSDSPVQPQTVYRCSIKSEVPGNNSGDENKILSNASSLMFLKNT